MWHRDDGETLFTAGPDGTVRRWNVATHQPRGPAFPALASPIESLAVSPDGKTLSQQRLATSYCR